VAAEAVDGMAVVRVRDHGGGLDEASLAHVFDRFWRADASRHGTGAGLGLSIVAAIAGAHGGVAWVESVEDRGTAFSVRLPRAGPPPVPVPTPD